MSTPCAAPNAHQTVARELTQAAFENHFRLVAYVLRSMRVSEQDVEELAQETFLRYHRHCLDVKPAGVKAWLATTARNVALDAIAKQKRRKTHVCHESALAAAKGLWDTATEGESARKDLGQEAIARLDEFTKNPRYQVLREFYIEGKSVKAIAGTTGLRVSSVTSALTRQRQTFAKAASTWELA